MDWGLMGDTKMNNNTNIGCPFCHKTVRILPPNEYVVVNTQKARELDVEYGIYHKTCYQTLKQGKKDVNVINKGVKV